VPQFQIWIGTIEISHTGEKTPNVFRPAFTVVTTWAVIAEEYREKCIRMLESYEWRLLDVERANRVPDNGTFSEEVEDMLKGPELIRTRLFTGRFIRIQSRKLIGWEFVRR